MRIAIDARELLGRPTGVGRFLSRVLAAWDDMPAAAAHEIVLCAPAAIDPPPGRRLRLSTAVEPYGVSGVSRTHGGGGTCWEQFTLPRLVRRAGADVLFAPAYTGPLRPPVPMVIAIHDVSFAAHPEWFTWREGLRRRLVTRMAARRAARVLTISEFSKREIVRHLGIDAGRIDVIALGLTAWPQAPAPAEAAPDAVLYVGSLFTRRHIPTLIDGFARLARRRPGVRLEIVGENRTTPRIDVDRLSAATGVADRIGLHSYVPDEELARLYRSAKAFVFLSEYEGFGLTPLEALAAGVPIVVLDTPVAREIYGPAAVYVERPDPDLVRGALERAVYDPRERARVLEAAPAVLSRYSWPSCARRVLDVLLACGDH